MTTTSDWVNDAACRNDNPNDWDLDVIGDNDQAVIDAIHTCLSCPVLAQCTQRDDQLAANDNTRRDSVVSSARVWGRRYHTMKFTGTCYHGVNKARAVCGICQRERGRYHERAEAAKYATLDDVPDRIRAGHAEWTRLRANGVFIRDIDPEIIWCKRVYQMVSKRARRAAGRDDITAGTAEAA
jgi:hypothetical protein